MEILRKRGGRTGHIILLVLFVVAASSCATSYSPPTTGPIATLYFEFDLEEGGGFVDISIYENPDECQGKLQIGRFYEGAKPETVSILAGQELAFSTNYNDVDHRGPGSFDVEYASRVFKLVPRKNTQYWVKLSNDASRFYWSVETADGVPVNTSQYQMIFENEGKPKWCVGNKLVSDL